MTAAVDEARPVWVVAGARTPMGSYNGPLKDVSAIDLGVVAARAALERGRVDPAWIDHVIVGNVIQSSGDAVYGARHVGLKAGVPVEVPALMVNRCADRALQAAISGAQLLQLAKPMSSSRAASRT